MSQENVEMVRAGIAAYNRGDLDAMLETYDPEVEFVTLLLGNHHGKEALRVLYEENRKDVLGCEADPCCQAATIRLTSRFGREPAVAERSAERRLKRQCVVSGSCPVRGTEVPLLVRSDALPTGD